MSLRLSEQIILAQNDVSNLCILPYLLPLLEDRDKSIRQLAISNLEALSSVLVASQTTHNPKDRIFISKLPVFLESLTARRTEFLLNKSAFRSFMTSYFSMTDLKSTNENSIFLYLINFVDNSPISIQSVLVDLMKDIEAPIKLISLMPTILLVLDLPHSTQQSKFLSSIVKNLNQTVSKAMNEAQIHSLTMKILSETTCSKIRIMFMENFPINFYMSIVKQKRQSALLLQLLELSFDRELSKSAKSLIKSIKFSGTIFKVGLKSTGYLAEESTNLSMKQLSLILELLMDVPILELTTCYFTILNNLLNKSEPGSEYAKQLLLTNLLVIVKNPVVESDLRVDILVQILRTSLNPSTQTLVLNVLSEIAQYSAHKVITNILPIFTFIGTMLKQDDEYTYHVISKTLLILLPNLTKQGTSKSQCIMCDEL